MSFTDNFPFSVASSSSFGIKVRSHWLGWRTLVQDHGLPVHSWLQIRLDLNLEMVSKNGSYVQACALTSVNLP